jgi:hypothetical protein
MATYTIKYMTEFLVEANDTDEAWKFLDESLVELDIAVIEAEHVTRTSSLTTITHIDGKELDA